ncbi:hypothetical protein MVEN_01788100 [Mycena venus]|uniref:F-box domain-containing protein n=1 Tax=Mycena venus TaxID=2733690 RepID=A0A8H7CLD8_9AGAR|nr:hypothetical protein MVEN_01788100 [Mycena venus]
MNSTPLLSRFPQELIDMVIRKNETDFPTLRSCSLVCRAFLSPSQACIFLEVELIPKESRVPRCQQLHNILVDSPHPRSYVRTLEITEGYSDLRWLTQDTNSLAVMGILQCLKSVRFLSLSAMWCDLPKNLRTSICELCKKSDIDYLYLDIGRIGLADFSQLVAPTSLTRLGMPMVVLPTPDEGEEVPLAKLPRLKTCSFWLHPSSLAVVAKWLVNKDALANLHIMWYQEWQLQMLQNILDAHMSNLRELSLVFLYCIDEPVFRLPVALSLVQLKTIHSVKIEFEQHPEGVSLWLARLLESSPPSLTKFGAEINFKADCLLDIDWAPLRNVVTLENFPVLVIFQVEIIPSTRIENNTALRLVKTIQNTLPWLHERGILRCKVLSPNE